MYIAQIAGRSANVYAPVQSPATNGQLLFGTIMSGAGNIKNLYIASTDPTPGTMNVKLRINGVVTTITATIPSGSLSAADISHTEAVVAGDVIDFVMTPAGGAPDAIINCSIEVDV